MYQSLWAPKPTHSSTSASTSRTTFRTTTFPTSALNTTPSSSPASTLQNTRRLINRLQWKSSLLQISRARAIASFSTAQHDALELSSAPTMFALDFYEYYTLLERILVLLLAFFNVRVPRETVLRSEVNNTSVSNGNSNSNGHIFNTGGLQQRMTYTHRYHANVLEALDKLSNPLYTILGGDKPVRRYLATAKEFRNRWKDAEDHASPHGGREGAVGSRDGGEDEVRRTTLEALDLDGMVECILQALDAALEMAERNDEVEANGGAVQNGVMGLGAWGEVEDCVMEDAPWEAVEDAMEWEIM